MISLWKTISMPDVRQYMTRGGGLKTRRLAGATCSLDLARYDGRGVGQERPRHWPDSAGGAVTRRRGALGAPVALWRQRAAAFKVSRTVADGRGEVGWAVRIKGRGVPGHDHGRTWQRVVGRDGGLVLAVIGAVVCVAEGRYPWLSATA